MRTMLGAALLVATAAMAGPARAADLPAPGYYTAPAPLSGFSWMGPYLGANIGYEWGDVSNNPTKPSGIAGGIEAGYNWQFGQFVTGIETDIQASAASDTFAPWQFTNPWFGTLRGRAGVAIGNVLVFGTAGLAYGSLTVDSPGNLSETRTSARLGGRRRRRSRLDAALVGQGRMALPRFVGPVLLGHRHHQWADRQPAAFGRQLSFLAREPGSISGR